MMYTEDELKQQAPAFENNVVENDVTPPNNRGISERGKYLTSLTIEDMETGEFQEIRILTKDRIDAKNMFHI